jgi:hypothetical protein
LGLCPVGFCSAGVCWLEFRPMKLWPVSLGRAVLCWARLCAVTLRFLLAGVYRLQRGWMRVLGGLPECEQLLSFGF